MLPLKQQIFAIQFLKQMLLTLLHIKPYHHVFKNMKG